MAKQVKEAKKFEFSKVGSILDNIAKSVPIVIGTNTIDLGIAGNLQSLATKLRIINQGVQKSSILVPHTTNI